MKLLQLIKTKFSFLFPRSPFPVKMKILGGPATRSPATNLSRSTRTILMSPRNHWQWPTRSKPNLLRLHYQSSMLLHNFGSRWPPSKYPLPWTSALVSQAAFKLFAGDQFAYRRKVSVSRFFPPAAN